MKCVIQHERLGEITYVESPWTGKKSLLINGQQLEKTAKNVFQTADGETVTLTGNFFRGTTATIGAETITLTPPCKWYEYLLAFPPFILILVWGNSVALCRILPVVGGAIGGAIGGVFLVLTMFAVRKVDNILLKILISVLMTGICFVICYLIALAILA
ncbi:MAG: hypothetical protein J1G38_06860 [Clostridiales bacterium]|nr:hypothetical protein [Clostridiales bacterium]